MIPAGHTPGPETCEFCAEIAGKPSRFAQLYGNGNVSRILYADDTFLIFPTLGQIGRHNLLIVTRRHIDCMAQLRSEEITRLDELVRHVQKRLSAYGHVVGFEHGAVGTTGGCNSISHAHFHLTALPGSIDLSRFYFPEDPVCRSTDFAESYRRLAGAEQYLLTRNEDAGCCFLDTTALPGKYPSQFFRRALAEYLHMKTPWDWRQCNYEPKLLDTLHVFARGLQ